MKRSFSLITIVSFVILGAPSAKAEVHMCFGKPATIVGTSGDDILQGTDGADVIVGLKGSDFIWGHAGRDLICGGRGDDGSYLPSRGVGELNGGLGSDKISGGRGNDEINGGFIGNPVDDPGPADTLNGNAGDDHICDNACYQNSYQSVDTGDDRLAGGPGNDIISSTGGDDHQRGGPGNDVMGAQLFRCDPSCVEEVTVDTGSDVYFAGSGEDTITASDGIGHNDRVDGGLDADMCTADPGDVLLNCEG